MFCKFCTLMKILKCYNVRLSILTCNLSYLEMEDNITYLEPTLEKHLKGHRNSITALFYNPNEQQLASSSLDNSILLWDLRGTMRSYKFQGHAEAVMDVTFSSSGRYMASASRDRTVRIWVPTVTGSIGIFKAHSQTVRSVQFSHDNSKIITASDDKIVKMWSSDKHKFLASFVGHTNWVRRACMSQDGSIIASCSDDKTTKLWNPDTGECIHTFKDQKGHGMYLAWHPSSCYIAVGTSLGNVLLYDIRSHNLVQYYSIHSGAITQLAFHPSGSYILTSSKDGKMKVLDLLEGHPIFTLDGHTGAVNAVTFSPSGLHFASGADDKLVNIWRTNFTELGNDLKENADQPLSTSRSQTSKAAKIWYQCYHSTKYPVVTFVHIENTETQTSIRNASLIENEPNAHSSIIESARSQNRESRLPSEQIDSSRRVLDLSNESPRECPTECSMYNVGHMSHIPRTPPSPATYTIPTVLNKSIGVENNKENIFGMIKLGENDVCYTSGTIEWVGRKRSFPLNTGFKTISSNHRDSNEPIIKKPKLNRTFTSGISKLKECDCADVLPTVNAIVDHLNALHEAVDLVDLRLNTIEDVMTKSD